MALTGHRSWLSEAYAGGLLLKLRPFGLSKDALRKQIALIRYYYLSKFKSPTAYSFDRKWQPFNFSIKD